MNPRASPAEAVNTDHTTTPAVSAHRPAAPAQPHLRALPARNRRSAQAIKECQNLLRLSLDQIGGIMRRAQYDARRVESELENFKKQDAPGARLAELRPQLLTVEQLLGGLHPPPPEGFLNELHRLGLVRNRVPFSPGVASMPCGTDGSRLPITLSTARPCACSRNCLPRPKAPTCEKTALIRLWLAKWPARKTACPPPKLVPQMPIRVRSTSGSAASAVRQLMASVVWSIGSAIRAAPAPRG